MFTNATVEVNGEKYICKNGTSDFDGIKIMLSITDENVMLELSNTTRNDIIVGDIVINASVKSDNLDRSYISPMSMLGHDGIFKNDVSVKSSVILGLTSSTGDNAILFTFTKPFDALYEFSATPSNCDWEISCTCKREGTTLNAGQLLSISPIRVVKGESLSNLLCEFADLFKTKTYDKIKSGWCSWYYYYGYESEQVIIDNMEMLYKSRIKDKINVIQIDDGWNLPYNGHECVWGDWHAGSKFPSGMKYIVDKIHNFGFEAGLWLAPFSVATESELAKQHPEWLVRKNDDDNLLTLGERYGLDLTNQDALQFIKETFERVFDTWGFDYIKIDFLSHGIVKGKRYDNTKTGVEAFRIGMDVIRKVAKDRFILNCGSPLFPSINYCDAMRIGADVGARWELPINKGNWFNGNCSLKPAIFSTLYRQWMHKRLWQNDPDCFVVRDCGSKYERLMFGDVFMGYKMKYKDYGLSENEAMFMVKTVWFTNTMKLLSEVWDELTVDRQKMLEKAFSDFELDTQMMDYYVNPELVVLKTSNDNLYIGIFNMSDETQNVTFPSKKFGIDKWNFTEVFDNEKFNGYGEYIEFPTLNPRTAKIWKITDRTE